MLLYVIILIQYLLASSNSQKYPNANNVSSNSERKSCSCTNSSQRTSLTTISNSYSKMEHQCQLYLAREAIKEKQIDRILKDSSKKLNDT